MKMIDKIEQRLSELDLGDKYDEVMDIVRDETSVVSDIVNTDVEIIVDSIDAGKVNVVSIPTGMLPKARAEQYIKHISNLIADVKPDNTDIMYIAIGSGERRSSIVKLDKESDYLLQIYTGSMPPERAKRHIEEQSKLFKSEFKFSEYNIAVCGVSDRANFTISDKK